MKLKAGNKIQMNESKDEYEIIKVYPDGYYDIQALKPMFAFMPNFRPIYYSIQLESYTII